MSETDIITQATAPGTFDVFSFLEGTAYPTDEVTVFQNAKAATELVAMNKERLDFDAIPEKDRPETSRDYDAEIERLTAAVKESAMTFELRGMPPGLVQELYSFSDDADEKAIRDAENNLIAGTIVAVRNASGARDAHVWSGEEVSRIRHYLKEGEFAKLVEGVTRVNFNAVVFDQAVDAGFLGRSSNLAP